MCNAILLSRFVTVNMDFQIQTRHLGSIAAKSFQMKFIQVIDICGCVFIRMIILSTKDSKVSLSMLNVRKKQVRSKTPTTSSLLK